MLRRYLLLGGLGLLFLGAVATYLGVVTHGRGMPTVATITATETLCLVTGRKGVKKVFSQAVACDAMENMAEEEGGDYTYQELDYVTLSYVTVEGRAQTAKTPAMLVGLARKSVGDTVSVRYDVNKPGQVDGGLSEWILFAGLVGLVTGPLMLLLRWKMPTSLAAPSPIAAARPQTATPAPLAAKPIVAPTQRIATRIAPPSPSFSARQRTARILQKP